jgi:hypothetical protein
MSSQENPPIDKEMRDHVLGPLSSHPFWIRWRSKFVYPLTLVIVGFLTWKFIPQLLLHHVMEFFFGLIPKGLFNLLLESADALPEGVRQLGGIVTAAKPDAPWLDPQYKIWLAAALFSGFVIAISLCNKWACMQAGLGKVSPSNKGKMIADDLAEGDGLTSATSKAIVEEAKERSSEFIDQVADDLTVPVIIAIGVALCVVVLPAMAYQLHWLPHLWEIALDLTLLAGLWVLVVLSRVPTEADPRKRRWWLLLVGIGFWAVPVYNAVVKFFTQGMGAALFSKPVPAKPVGMDPRLTTALWVLGAIALLAWFFWRKGLKQEKAKDELTTVEQQDLVAQILAELKTPHRETKPLAPIQLGEVSDKPTAPSFWPLFTGGIIPTSDQMAYFEKFRAGWLELMTRVEEAPETSDWWNGFNLLLMGGPGSGKTTALIASALHAALAGGVRPLLIVPRADKRRWLVSRIGEILATSRLDTNFNCGELDSRAVRLFVERGEPLPTLFVATPDDIESSLFGMVRDGNDEERRERTARYECLLESLSAVMIENLADFDPIGRSHLAFQIEKIRLHLASKGIAMVSVAASPKLDEQGAVAMGSRLFGETGFRPERDTVALRLPPTEKQCQSVELTSPKPADLAEEIASCLLRRDLAAILLRKGIDEEACAEQQKKISAAAGAGHLVVLGDLDQRVVHDGGFDSIVYQNLTTLDATVAVGLRFKGDSTVLFHVRPESRPLLIEPKESALPSLAAAGSPALSLLHTVSLWSTLRDGAVMESEWLKRLLPGYSREKTPQVSGKQLVELRLEPGLSGTNDLVILSRSAASIQPIDAKSIPTTSIFPQVSAAGDNHALSIIRRNEKDLKESTCYRWVSGTGQIMSSQSVEYSPVLILRSDDGTFAAGSMHRTEDGRIAITARHYAGRGEDTVLPILELNWKSEGASLRMKGGGQDYGVSWNELVQGDRPAEITVRGEVAGLVSESGLESRQTGIPFEFPALLSAVLLHGEAQEGLEIEPDGCWNTTKATDNRVCNPDATRRIAEFLCENVDGASNFCWPIVFSQAGKVVIWLLEPSGTGQSVSKILFELLAGKAFREEWIKCLSSESFGSGFLAPAPRIGFTRKVVATVVQSDLQGTHSEKSLMGAERNFGDESTLHPPLSGQQESTSSPMAVEMPEESAIDKKTDKTSLENTQLQ